MKEKYQWDSPYEWLEWAVENYKINEYQLLELIEKNINSDQIQEMFEEEMDRSKYFELKEE